MYVTSDKPITWDADRKVAVYKDSYEKTHDLQLQMTITNDKGRIAATESDLEHIVFQVKNNEDTAFEAKLKDFKCEEKTNAEGEFAYILYSRIVDFPQELYVNGNQDLTCMLYDTVTGITEGSPTSSVSGPMLVIEPTFDVQVIGDTVIVTPQFVIGKNITAWLQLSLVGEVENITNPEPLTFSHVTAGEHEVRFKLYYNGTQINYSSFNVTVDNWTAAPTVTLSQTAANTLTVSISGKAPGYSVEYSYTQNEKDYVYTVSTTARNGVASVTLKKLPVSTRVDVKVYPTNSGDTCNHYGSAHCIVADWTWTKKPSLKAYQDMTQEGMLVLEFTDNEIQAFKDGALVGYEVYANNNYNTLYVYSDEGNYYLGPTKGQVYGVDEEDVWLVYVPYAYAKATETIKVTPVLLNTDGTIAVRGTAATVKYDRSRFVDEAWAVAPTVVQNPVDCNTVSFKVTLNARATDAVVYIDGALYADGKNVLTLSTLPTTGPVTARQDADHIWTVTLTYGTDPLVYGKHKIAFAAVDPEEAVDDPYGTASKAVTVSISKEPAWVSKKMAVTAVQTGDTSVTLTFTNLGLDTTAGLRYYELNANGTTFTIELNDENLTPADKKATKLNYEFEVPGITYGDYSTFTVNGYGYYDEGVDFTGKTGTAKVKMTELWKTAPTLKFTPDSVQRAATLTVTGKGAPNGFNIYVYDETDKTWHCVDGESDLEEKDYVIPHGITIKMTDKEGPVAKYTITATESFTRALQFKAEPYKSDEDNVTNQENPNTSEPEYTRGNTSKAAKLTISPAWATKAVKPTATQTAENAFTVTWKAVSGADRYDVEVYKAGETEAYQSTTVKDATTAVFPDMPVGTYTVTVQPYIVNDKEAKEWGTVSKAVTVKVEELWNKTPVVKVTSVTGFSVSGTVTYYGQPDSVNVTAVMGAINRQVSIPVTEYAGAKGKKVNFTVYITTTDNITADNKYTPGTYSVQAFTTKSGSDPSENSKSVTAKLQDSFLENPAKIKSIVQINEFQATLTLSKALGKATDNRWYIVALEDKDGNWYWTSYEYFPADQKVVTLNFANAQHDLTFETDTLHIIPYERTEIGGRQWTGNDFAVPAGDYLSGTFGQTVPEFTVQQVGYNTLHLVMTKGTAYSYAIKVNGEYLYYGQDYEKAYQSATNNYVDVSGSLAEGSRDVKIAVVPLVNDIPDEDHISAEQSLTLKQDWNEISNVTAEPLKKSPKLKVTCNYVSAADGVYVSLYDAATGEIVSTENVSYLRIQLTEGKKANTAVFTVDTQVKGEQLVGNYLVEVTPYLGSSETPSGMTVGDSVVGAKAVTISRMK